MNSGIILTSEQPQSSALEEDTYSATKSTNQTVVRDKESDQFQDPSDSLIPKRNKPRSRRSIMASKLISPVYVHYDSHPTMVNKNMSVTGTNASTSPKATNSQTNPTPSSSNGIEGTPLGQSNGKATPNAWSRSHMRSIRRLSNDAADPPHEIGKKSKTTNTEDKLNLSGHSSYLTFKEPVEEILEVETKEEEPKPSFDSDFKIPNDTRVNERGKIIHAYFGGMKTNVNVNLSSSSASTKTPKAVLSNKSKPKSKSTAPSSSPNKYNRISNNTTNGTNNLNAKVIAQKKSVSARRLREIRSRERGQHHSARKLTPTPLVSNESDTNNDYSPSNCSC